jgi:hypothetical protein
VNLSCEPKLRGMKRNCGDFAGKGIFCFAIGAAFLS